MTLIHTSIEHLQRLTDLFQKRRAQLAADVGLTEHQWGVLEEISTEHFMPSMFARQRESSAAAVSKTLRQLLEKGLVAVSLHDTDARQRHYVLTAKGKRTMSSLRKSRADAIDVVWTKINPQQLRSFNEFAQELETRLMPLVNQSSNTE